MYIGGSSTPLHPTSIQPYPLKSEVELSSANQNQEFSNNNSLLDAAERVPMTPHVENQKVMMS